MSYRFSSANATIRRPFHTSVIKWSLSQLSSLSTLALSFYCSHAHIKSSNREAGRGQSRVNWQAKWWIRDKKRWCVHKLASRNCSNFMHNHSCSRLVNSLISVVSCVFFLYFKLYLFWETLELCLFLQWLHLVWMPLNKHTWSYSECLGICLYSSLRIHQMGFCLAYTETLRWVTTQPITHDK